MIDAVIKYYFMSMCAFIFFTKLLNLKTDKHNKFIHLLSFMIMDLFILITIKYVPEITVVFVFITLFMYSTITYDISFRIATVTSILSVGLSYFTLILSIIITSPISLLHLKNYVDISILYPIYTLIVGITQTLISIFIFRIRRLKNGMPFLLEKLSNTLGIVVSCLILTFASLFTILDHKDIAYYIPFILCTILSLLLYIWWRKQLTISYVNKAHKFEIEKLEEELDKLKADNERLSKLVHKDNKLIPAMIMAVTNILNELKNSSDADFSNKVSSLLDELTILSNERTGILNSGNHNTPFISTNVIRLDSVITYMREKAHMLQIEFDCIIDMDVKEMIKECISEDSLCTIIADLTENAIIATKKCEIKNVLIKLHKKDGAHCISFYDSGIPFEAYTIENAGKKRASTHLDEGGSGIGLMSTFELLKESKASFVIDESIESDVYTKEVAVLFDGKGEFRVERGSAKS